jgi:hypothetical protein
MRGAEDEPLAAGTVVDGRYRVIAELGAGGMGRVYEAEHMFIRRGMALKLLLRSEAGAEGAARMIQEATLAGQVPHPAVVRVFDCAALADGQVYVAMELLRGETLEAALRRSIDAATALAAIAEVARGLAAVHRVGVVHRDIKPGNIFLARGPDGVQAKLLDFGVAKALPGTSELASGAVRTQAGAVIGTPYYVAPEQIRGGAIDGRADLYGLGVILYEVLTGELPFVGDSHVAILAQHMRTPPLDPRQAAPGRGIPDGAARLTMTLLAKEPEGRMVDGDAVAEAIAAVLAAEGEALRGVWTGSGVRGAVGADGVTLPPVGGTSGTARLVEASAVSGSATVRLAEESAGRGVAASEVSGSATVRLDEAGEVRGRVTGRLGGVRATAPSAGLAEGTGEVPTRVRRAWWIGGVAAIGGVAVIGWIVARAPAGVDAREPAVPVPAPAVRVEAPAEAVVTGGARVGPQPVAAESGAAVAGPAAPVKAAEGPAVKASPRPIKGKKTAKDGGTTRPPAKAASAAGDPPLKPDVYGDD